MLSRWLALGLSTLALAACGGPEEEPAETRDVTQSVESGPARIRFAADWSRTVTGALVAGGQVRVSYDPARLPQCRGDANGRPAYAITAFAKVNDGGVLSAVIDGLTPDGRAPTGEVTFDLPAAGELQLWFQVTNRWGCADFDSDFGRNFRFAIQPPAAARLVFDRAWNETVIGPLQRGGDVTLEYDLARLPSCRATYRGNVSWDVNAYYRFDGGAATRLAITRGGNTDRYAVPTTLAIPAGARQLELWFHNNDSNGCSQYDSDFGANYRFAIP